MDGVPTLKEYVAKLEHREEQRNAKRRKVEEDRAKRAKAAEEAKAAAAAAAKPPPPAPAPAPVAAAPTPLAGRIPEPPDQVTEPCIEVVKDGQRMERLRLGGTKDSWTFGRAAEQVDFPMQHSSLSRQHASLTSRDGQMFITDLGSVHGTFVDGRKLAAKVPVRLFSGANIRFGASTRHYIYREPMAAVVPSLYTAAVVRPGGPQPGGKGGGSARFRYRSTMSAACNDFSGL
uniref:FHA domain-containing protein n=1 Tax=Alexandrium monilatum TaxID=311494 RepID=A0A7S4V2F6_9DINO